MPATTLIPFELERNIPHPDKEGYLQFERMATFQECQDAVQSHLKRTVVEYDGESVQIFDLLESDGICPSVRYSCNTKILACQQGKAPARLRKKEFKVRTLETKKSKRYICFICNTAGLVQPQDKIAARASRNLSLFVRLLLG